MFNKALLKSALKFTCKTKNSFAYYITKYFKFTISFQFYKPFTESGVETIPKKWYDSFKQQYKCKMKFSSSWKRLKNTNPISSSDICLCFTKLLASRKNKMNSNQTKIIKPKTYAQKTNTVYSILGLFQNLFLKFLFKTTTFHFMVNTYSKNKSFLAIYMQSNFRNLKTLKES